MQKSALRKKMLDMRSNMDIVDKVAQDKIISDKVCSLYQENLRNRVNSIGIYLPMLQEVDTYMIIDFFIANDITVAIPITQPKSMVFNVITHMDRNTADNKKGLELLAKQSHTIIPDALIVPMVACDINNNRLGYGGGYYDKYIAAHKSYTIGVCYGIQKIESIPTEPHDISLDIIISS